MMGGWVYTYWGLGGYVGGRGWGENVTYMGTCCLKCMCYITDFFRQKKKKKIDKVLEKKNLFQYV